MRQRTRRAIEDLVEMATRLAEYRFDQHIRDVGLAFRMTRQPDDTWLLEFDLPEDKERDATLYTLRLFDQQNEAFSFHNLRRIAEDAELSDAYRQALLRIRQSYYRVLQQYPAAIERGFFEDEELPTQGEIMRVVMNGGLGHRRNPLLRRRFKTWTCDSIREGVLFQAFASIIHSVLLLVNELLILSREELARA